MTDRCQRWAVELIQPQGKSVRLVFGAIRQVDVGVYRHQFELTFASNGPETLKRYPLKVSRIASGVPIGGDLKYVDQVTLKRAMEGRRDVTE